ncbi:MAG: hypothetical protein WC861_06930 [Candidatus Micrarchaeia archaeon]|jgi:hypothetical protein
MQKASALPFTVTIRKNVTAGKKITFSGARAQRFAGQILENVILLNSSVKEEKKQILQSLFAVIRSGEALVAAPQEGKGALMEQYALDLGVFRSADQKLHLKLNNVNNGLSLPEIAARKQIMSEHLPTLLSTIHLLGGLLLSAVRMDDAKKADKWLRTLKDGADRTDALFGLLDKMDSGSVWEIKALAENTCTRAALRQAGIVVGSEAEKAQLRKPAPPAEG